MEFALINCWWQKNNFSVGHSACHFHQIWPCIFHLMRVEDLYCPLYAEIQVFHSLFMFCVLVVNVVMCLVYKYLIVFVYFCMLFLGLGSRYNDRCHSSNYMSSGKAKHPPFYPFWPWPIWAHLNRVRSLARVQFRILFVMLFFLKITKLSEFWLCKWFYLLIRIWQEALLYLNIFIILFPLYTMFYYQISLQSSTVLFCFRFCSELCS